LKIEFNETIFLRGLKKEKKERRKKINFGTL